MYFKKFIKNKIYYILILFLFFVTSCAASTASKAYCDETVSCLDGYECVKNKCEKLDLECSSKNKYGYCKEENKECYDGICKTLKEAECENIDCSNHGICDLDISDRVICICEDGYTPNGANCVENGVVLCGGETVCLDAEHCENDSCEDNVKKVQCDRHIDIPENGEVIIIQFDINWLDGKWEEIKKCEWECKQGFKKDETGKLCIVEPDECSLLHPTGICEIEGYLCIDGSCTPPPAIGAECHTSSQCPDEMICILNGIEKGYCTRKCIDDSVCEEYKCGDFLQDKYCLQSCNNILDCRDDFTCNDDKLCRPKCLDNSDCKDYQICNMESGLCINQDLNCSIFDNNCTDETKSCYPFEEINYTACSETGILDNGKMCNKDNICKQGSICTEVEGLTNKRCATACKPSQGTAGNNQECEDYNNCITVLGWNDLGYCKYDSSLKPVGLECNSDLDCDYNNGTCMAFENYNICVASGCPQQTVTNTSLYPNEVVCVGMNVNGTWTKYWMDTCENDSDCYSSNFICYENTSDNYPSKYCRPRP